MNKLKSSPIYIYIYIAVEKITGFGSLIYEIVKVKPKALGSFLRSHNHNTSLNPKVINILKGCEVL